MHGNGDNCFPGKSISNRHFSDCVRERIEWGLNMFFWFPLLIESLKKPRRVRYQGKTGADGTAFYSNSVALKVPVVFVFKSLKVSLANMQ